MAAFPKYHKLICDTFTPTFVAGPTPCTIQSGNASRSRLVAGGTFFRSIDHGAVNNVNAITVAVSVGPTTSVGDVDSQDVTVTVNAPWIGSPEVYNFTQSYDTVLFACSGSPGPDQLRALINGVSVVITMPTNDVVQPWIAATNDVDCLMTAFVETSLSGAVGLPAGEGTIRTGPAYTLFHVASAETEADGSMTEVNAISEWNGANWEAHPSPLYEINSLGVITPDPGC